MKKVLALSILCMLAFVLVIPMIAAQEEERGLDKEITQPEWFVSVIEFLGLGDTWALVIASIAVAIMIFAATYDVLAFTAFESNWVKYLIALGVAVIAGIARGVTAVTAALMGIAGGSVAIATALAIILAVLFFFLTGIAKGKMKHYKAKQHASEAEDAFAIAEKTTAAHVSEANAARKANEATK